MQHPTPTAIRSASSRSFATRLLALALVGFMCLSSGRALVPGLCATQTALLDEQQQHAEQRQSCCAIPRNDTSGQPTFYGGTTGAPPCSFCALATARTVLVEAIAVVSTPEQRIESSTGITTVLHAQEYWNIQFSRGPPSRIV